MKGLELTDAMVEGAAEELYHPRPHKANTGAQQAASYKPSSETFARRVIGAGHTAELVRRSQQPGVLP